MGGKSSHHHYHTDTESLELAKQAQAEARRAHEAAEKQRLQLEEQRRANERMFEQQRQAQERAAREAREAQERYQRQIAEAQRLRQQEAREAAERLEAERQQAALSAERARQEQAEAARRLEAEQARRVAEAEAASRRLEEERVAAQQRVEEELQRERDRVHTEKLQKWRDLNRDYPVPEYLGPFVTGVLEGFEEDRQQERFVNVGVLGNSGTGKSSLIKAILEYFNEGADEDGAPRPISCFEADGTRAPMQYKMNNFSDKVRVWDLPGQGTEMFPAKTYLRDMGLKYLDAVLVTTDGRWTENDAHLVQAIKFAQIWTSIVRTKVDQAVEAGQEDHGYNQDYTLEIVRARLAEQVGEPADSENIHLVTTRRKYWAGLHGGTKFGNIDRLCEQVSERVEFHQSWLVVDAETPLGPAVGRTDTGDDAESTGTGDAMETSVMSML